jgi:hypothetical protein
VAIPAHQPAAALEPAVAEVAEVAGD